MINFPDFDGTQACVDLDTNIFFPDSEDRKAVQAAKDICNSCNQLEKCFTYAVWEPSLEGVWGATTPRQRESWRSRARKAKRNAAN